MSKIERLEKIQKYNMLQGTTLDKKTLPASNYKLGRLKSKTIAIQRAIDKNKK